MPAGLSSAFLGYPGSAQVAQKSEYLDSRTAFLGGIILLNPTHYLHHMISAFTTTTWLETSSESPCRLGNATSAFWMLKFCKPMSQSAWSFFTVCAQ